MFLVQHTIIANRPIDNHYLTIMLDSNSDTWLPIQKHNSVELNSEKGLKVYIKYLTLIWM